MTLIALESFDLLADSAAAVAAKGWVTSDFAGFLSGRTGPQALRCDNDNNGTLLKSLLGNAHVTFTIGCAVYLSNVFGNPQALFSFQTSGETQVTIGYLWPFGQVAAWRGQSNTGTLLGQGGYLAAGAWNYIEAMVTLNASTGSVLVKLNGATVINLSGVNTYNGGGSTFDSIAVGPDHAGTFVVPFAIDDLYVTNAAGSVNTGMLGDTAVEVIQPDGNGDLSQLTNSSSTSVNNYSYVNNPTSQTATYVEGSSALTDTYTFAELATASGTVSGVQLCIYAGKSSAGSRSVAPVIRVSGTSYTGTAEVLSTSPLYTQQLYEEDPATSAPWTIGEVNAAQYGVEVS